MLGPSHGPSAPPPEVFPSVPPPEVFPLLPLSDSLLSRRWLSSSEEISFACADANPEESFAIVSVKVATVALSAVVAVDKLARASTVSAWWFCTLVASTAFALGKCCPAVRRRFALHPRCALAKCTLNLGQVRSRSGKRFHSLRSSLNTPVYARQSSAMSTTFFEVKGASPN